MGADMSVQMAKSLVIAGTQCKAETIEIASSEATRTPRSDSSADRSPTVESDEDSSGVVSRGNTVIIFDWDDTLLCSTAVNLGSTTRPEYKALEKAIGSMLSTASRLGEVMIITNGNKNWVKDSASRYLPGLLPVLEKLTVVSARARCEQRYPGDPYLWKKVAFEEMLVDERSFADDGMGLNIIALGDQKPEIEAAHNVGRMLNAVQGQSFVKTVKFAERPTVSELIGQLARVEAELAAIVHEESTGYRTMYRQFAPNMPRDKTNMSDASAWKVTTQVDASWCIKSALSVKEIWPLFA